METPTQDLENNYQHLGWRIGVHIEVDNKPTSIGAKYPETVCASDGSWQQQYDASSMETNEWTCSASLMLRPAVLGYAPVAKAIADQARWGVESRISQAFTSGALAMVYGVNQVRCFGALAVLFPIGCSRSKASDRTRIESTTMSTERTVRPCVWLAGLRTFEALHLGDVH